MLLYIHCCQQLAAAARDLTSSPVAAAAQSQHGLQKQLSSANTAAQLYQERAQQLERKVAVLRSQVWGDVCPGYRVESKWIQCILQGIPGKPCFSGHYFVLAKRLSCLGLDVTC